MFDTTVLDISKAAKLKGLAFQCGYRRVGWALMVLKPVESKNFQQAFVYIDPLILRSLAWNLADQQWPALDRPLA